jgi:tetratricopeptide (TPR) repeat protein
MTICLAQAYQTANDFGTARYELESLLSENTRDTNCCNNWPNCARRATMRSRRSVTSGNWWRSRRGTRRSIHWPPMLQDFGYRDEANEILVRLTRREEDPIRLLRSIDSLLTRNGQEAALEIIEPMLSQQRDDWELLYREIVALTLMEKNEEAANRCQRLLAIKQSHDALGRSAEARFKQAQQKARSDNLRGNVTSMPTRESPLMAMRYAGQVQQATGMMSDPYGGYGGAEGAQVPCGLPARSRWPAWAPTLGC